MQATISNNFNYNEKLSTKQNKNLTTAYKRNEMSLFSKMI